MRYDGRAVRELKVSSRNVTPTPSAPPTCSKVSGVQGFVRQHPVATSERNQHLAGVLEIEEIDDSEVLILILSDPDDRHEAVQGHRIIIPYQDDRLDFSPVALRQSLGEFRPRFGSFGMIPLLELVDHQQDLV